MYQNYTQDIEEICETALVEGLHRPLTQDEVNALRWACNIPEHRIGIRTAFPWPHGRQQTDWVQD